LSRCRERLAEYSDAGLDLPILWPAIGVDSGAGSHCDVPQIKLAVRPPARHPLDATATFSTCGILDFRQSRSAGLHEQTQAS